MHHARILAKEQPRAMRVSECTSLDGPFISWKLRVETRRLFFPTACGGPRHSTMKSSEFSLAQDKMVVKIKWLSSQNILAWFFAYSALSNKYSLNLTQSWSWKELPGQRHCINVSWISFSWSSTRSQNNIVIIFSTWNNVEVVGSSVWLHRSSHNHAWHSSIFCKNVTVAASHSWTSQADFCWKL